MNQFFGIDCSFFERIFRSLSILSMTLGLSVGALAQQLELFEETESADRAREIGNSSQTVRDRDGNIITGPQFTLIGTSRIGDNYLLVIEDHMGEIISMSAPGGQIRSIPGHPGFQVARVGSGDASILYPDGIPCIEFREQGVTCESAEVARVTLTNQEPLESSTSVSQLVSSDDSAPASPSINPFEALLERAADPSENSATGSFEPIRIDPKDVPQGMKVVSTPFGDRLVEDDC